MSSSTAPTALTVSSSATSNVSGSNLRATSTNQVAPSFHTLATQFREIHKNTWLKRLTAEGKKITVGPKKSDRSWVVFCVHDDTEAVLEGYAEPRQSAAHIPEWIVPLKHTLHISHALITNSHEFEFVVALNNEVVRFHAVSWEIMQEWVETLRAKLREMKILSPRENLYTKLPEVRVPLLPTRDPTSPLPAPPPVPAALVPGVERIMPHTVPQFDVPTHTEIEGENTEDAQPTNEITPINYPNNSESNNNTSGTSSRCSTPTTTTFFTASGVETNKLSSMSNTHTQNLLNMLSNPITAYSEHINTVEANNVEDTDESNDVEPCFNLEQTSLPSSSHKSPSASDRCVRNSIRVDNNKSAKSSPELNASFQNIFQCDRLLPRLQTTRSLSAGAADKARNQAKGSVNFVEKKTVPKEQSITTSSINNITELEISCTTPKDISKPIVTGEGETSSNITIIEVSSNDCKGSNATKKTANIPSRNTNADIFQFPDISTNRTVPISPVSEYKCNVQIIPSDNEINNSSTIQVINTENVSILPETKTTNAVATTTCNGAQVTTVHVSGFKSKSVASSDIYGRCYNATTLRQSQQLNNRIILSANASGITNITVNDDCDKKRTTQKQGNLYYEKVFLSSSTPSHLLQATSSSSPIKRHSEIKNVEAIGNKYTSVQPRATNNNGATSHSPVLAKRHIASPTTNVTPEAVSLVPQRRPQLARGATEAVITRHSRHDLHAASKISNSVKSNSETINLQAGSVACNNNEETRSRNPNSRKIIMNQRRRSASTSDAQQNLRSSNNNETTLINNRSNFRMQQPPHMYPPSLNNTENCESIVAANVNSPLPKRMTLREQQVMQLRREIMHPGGVRLQLRRKDCLGSIAWVDCFSSVWVAGWKQKENPVLYNALHIGDQLLSITGVAISSANEANKIIRSANTLFVEVLVRRIPFGHGYAIRRDREGQCLGLIRDGNTATIVDVVPNSIAERHGLPPKAQSCDGSALTFWVLTEINGRPLNLFFKENEIRDRLNSVGRDISILVQPSDLITKLKKQLKTLRGYKDYLVQ